MTYFMSNAQNVPLQQPHSYSQQQPQDNDNPIISLVTLIKQLYVIFNIIINFDNLDANGIDLTKTLETQGWNNYFNLFKGVTFPALFKEFWYITYILN